MAPRVGVTPGNQMDFVAVAGFDSKTVPSNAQDVVLNPAAESTEATYSYNAADQFTVAGAIGAVTYNSDGDQTAVTGPAPRGAVSFGFDGRHFVTSQIAGGVSTTWSIDGEARVVKQVKGGAETRYRYVAPGDTPMWEEDAAGNVTTIFVAGPLGLLATYVWGTPVFHVLNAHGDQIQLRNLSGTLTDAYVYAEGGEPTNTTGGPLPGRHGYLAAFQKDHEEDSGFMRMGVRMYDTTTMRFASVDPIEGADWNAYSYAAQDPINGMDLTGEMHIDGGGGRGCDARTCSKAAYDKRAKSKKKKGILQRVGSGIAKAGTAIKTGVGKFGGAAFDYSTKFVQGVVSLREYWGICLAGGGAVATYSRALGPKGLIIGGAAGCIGAVGYQIMLERSFGQ